MARRSVQKPRQRNPEGWTLERTGHDRHGARMDTFRNGAHKAELHYIEEDDVDGDRITVQVDGYWLESDFEDAIRYKSESSALAGASKVAKLFDERSVTRFPARGESWEPYLKWFKTQKPNQADYVILLSTNDPNGSYDNLLMAPLSEAEDVFAEAFAELESDYEDNPAGWTFPPTPKYSEFKRYADFDLATACAVRKSDRVYVKAKKKDCEEIIVYHRDGSIAARIDPQDYSTTLWWHEHNRFKPLADTGHPSLEDALVYVGTFRPSRNNPGLTQQERTTLNTLLEHVRYEEPSPWIDQIDDSVQAILDDPRTLRGETARARLVQLRDSLVHAPWSAAYDPQEDRDYAERELRDAKGIVQEAIDELGRNNPREIPDDEDEDDEGDDYSYERYRDPIYEQFGAEYNNPKSTIEYGLFHWRGDGRYKRSDAVKIYKREADARRASDKAYANDKRSDLVVRPSDYWVGENPYMGDAVELAKQRKYDEARRRWEREGRMGPPPSPPRSSRQRNPREVSLAKRIGGR